MKKMLILGALLTMFLVSLCGSVVATSSQDTTVNPGPAMQPVTTPDAAKQKMTIWAPGTLTLPHILYPNAVERYTNGVSVIIPASNSVMVDTPITLPSNINGKSTSVSSVFIRWYSFPAGAITLTKCQVYSQNQYIGEYTIGEAGTGSDMTTTVYFGNSYPVPGGLTVAWTFTDNTVGGSNICNIYGFGTKIKYAA